LIGWAILLCIGLRLLPGYLQIPAAMGLALIYSIIVYFTFKQHSYWLPLAVPVLWQVPLATLATLFWRYADVKRERRNIRQAFGYHLPVNVVDQLAEGINHITDNGQRVHGIILATDAQQYTALSEQLDPQALRNLMNRYYETLFTPIRQHNGVVSDVVGDAAMAIWASTDDDRAKRQAACLAALDILTAVEQFNAAQSSMALPTRMGLHYGEIVMGHVGAVDHYEYRAVGDIVNTATRIEGLNKRLGTRILASDAVLASLDGINARKLGRFLLAGKQKPITIYELLGNQKQATDDQQTQFIEAVEQFAHGDWQGAYDRFSQYLEQNPLDGPSQFYKQLAQEYLRQPPAEWDGIIRMSEK
jgi:adenylate cyclase